MTEKSQITILVVEHDEPLRRLAARALAREGHSVVAVASGRDALRLCGRSCGISVVVADAALPDLAAAELARLLPGLEPAARLLLLVAESNEGPRDGSDLPGVHCLATPFEPDELVRAVAALL